MRIPKITLYTFLIGFFVLTLSVSGAQERPRLREAGIKVGVLPVGSWNAITDVAGVKVGHKTVWVGDSVRTGVTVILPHDGNLFRGKVPAAIYVGNGFGKLIGKIQIQELGEIESPVALTNTLNVFRVADALVDYTLGLPGNEGVRSFNPVVGETNDSRLNDIRNRPVTRADVLEAIKSAKEGPVEEGNVGAGTGTVCFGFKGGIGTSSRVIPESRGGYTVGVLAQTNFGGILQINGVPVGQKLNQYYMRRDLQEEGSCAIVVATDAPLSARNLQRLAKRALLGIARTGGFMSNGSGDYVIAFTTYRKNRNDMDNRRPVDEVDQLPNDRMSPLFLAVVEATEEAIYNSLFKAETMTGFRERKVEALPLEKVIPWLIEE
ncbi:MAG: P1 family peptidase [bacterium]